MLCASFFVPLHLQKQNCPMKLKIITTKDIKKCHPNENPSPTDRFYQQLANRLQGAFCSFDGIIDEFSAEVMHRGAIVLANYLEDIVADSGQWRTFSALCQEMYGHPVPLYHQDEEYYPDEPSLNAVRYLLWCVMSEVSKQYVFPDAKPLELMSNAAYDILDEAFDEAPVNEQLADDVESELRLATKDFIKLRRELMWVLKDCYLISGEQNEELIYRYLEEFYDMSEREDLPETSPDMALFFAGTQSIFNHKVGPLALFPKDYLAALMRTKGMEQAAEEVAKIEKLGSGFYKFQPIKPSLSQSEHASETEWLRLTCTNGKEIEIEAWELNLPKGKEKDFDGCIASSFVFYQNRWHLNGLIIPLSETAKKWKELCEDDPEYLKPGMATLTAEMMLERTDGQQIAYFANKEELKDFLEKKIRFPRHMMSFVDEEVGELPTLFIDTEEPKNCMQLFFGYSPCIADPDNPFYDKETARQEASDMIGDAESLTTHAVKYLLEHNFLPDIYDDELLSRHSSHEEKRHDIDFLMRFYRRENY